MDMSIYHQFQLNELTHLKYITEVFDGISHLWKV